MFTQLFKHKLILKTGDQLKVIVLIILQVFNGLFQWITSMGE